VGEEGLDGFLDGLADTGGVTLDGVGGKEWYV
jgi:hypothetical protein